MTGTPEIAGTVLSAFAPAVLWGIALLCTLQLGDHMSKASSEITGPETTGGTPADSTAAAPADEDKE